MEAIDPRPDDEDVGFSFFVIYDDAIMMFHSEQLDSIRYGSEDDDNSLWVTAGSDDSLWSTADEEDSTERGDSVNAPIVRLTPAVSTIPAAPRTSGHTLGHDYQPRWLGISPFMSPNRWRNLDLGLVVHADSQATEQVQSPVYQVVWEDDTPSMSPNSWRDLNERYDYGIDAWELHARLEDLLNRNGSDAWEPHARLEDLVEMEDDDDD